MAQKIFSIPLNPKLAENQFKLFYSFLKEYKDWIYDIYFTCRIPPFTQDAMGEVFTHPMGPSDAIWNAINLQKDLGIPISATFNNTLVRPTQQNLDLWIKNFAPLYEQGVTNITIPHTHWMLTGQIKKEFPDLFVKNTILWRIREARDIVKLADAGFDYVNLDRMLMRDRDRLARIKEAKNFSGIKLSLLTNENCLGGCPLMDEHFQFNNSRDSGPQYFHDPISRVSCVKWDVDDPSSFLKNASMPPWREDWAEFLDLGIDVFKMHGRESQGNLFASMQSIKAYADGNELLMDTYNDYMDEDPVLRKALDSWRKKIKNCKFDCWDCNYCDNLYQVKYGKPKHKLLQLAVTELVESVNMDLNIDIPGLTSKRVQKLLNGFGKETNHYLEIGSFVGATACAVAANNTIKITCVDDWKEDVQPMKEGLKLPENSKESFINNIKRYKGDNEVRIFESDLLMADVSEIRDVDFFFYDGPTSHLTQAIPYYQGCFSDVCLMIFDDANWDGVVYSAREGIKRVGRNILYSKIMLNDVESENHWWNGLYITVTAK